MEGGRDVFTRLQVLAPLSIASLPRFLILRVDEALCQLIIYSFTFMFTWEIIFIAVREIKSVRMKRKLKDETMQYK